jgi:hypothetical protein
VRGPQRDVGPDERRDRVEHLVGEEPLKQLRIGVVRHVEVLRPLAVRAARQDPLERRREPRKLFG